MKPKMEKRCGCKRYFKVQDWKRGIEREVCLSCQGTLEVLQRLGATGIKKFPEFLSKYEESRRIDKEGTKMAVRELRKLKEL